MNNDEKSLLDEVWDAVGLDRPDPETPAVKPKTEVPAEDPKPTGTVAEEAVEEPAETPAEEAPAEVTAEAPAEEAPAEGTAEAPVEEATAEVPAEEAPAEEPVVTPMDLVQEKKKDIRFLVIYTVAFVVVISFLIGGSYLITSRIHREMAESNENLNTSQSTLKNIQEENRSLKEQNQALQEENNRLSASAAATDELMTSVGDMIEHGEYLTAAQDAYIRGNRTLARAILATVEREKLSQPAKDYYDTLNDRLN